MIPKEKAKELVRQFYSIGSNECKQCALIAVDEILKLSIKPDIYEKWWQEVKTEIENL